MSQPPPPPPGPSARPDHPPTSPPPPPPGPSAPPTPPGLDDRQRSLDPRIVAVWRTFSALWLVPLLGGAAVVSVVLLGTVGWIGVVVALGLLALLLGWYPPARYDRWGWQLTDLALELRRGVVIQQRSVVPYFRIQQIDVTQGPIDRLLGLATLQVTTAAASGTVALPGIASDDAPDVRAELLWRAARAVDEHPGELSDAV